jgi:hypothetical protein
MLTKLIVSSYQTLIEVSLWVFLLFSLVLGWNVGDGVLGAIVGLVIGFVLAVMLFGAFLTLGDIRQSARNIESSVGEALLQNRRDSISAVSLSSAPPVSASRLVTSQSVPSPSPTTSHEEPTEQCRICGECFARHEIMAHVRAHATESSETTISPESTRQCDICGERVEFSRLTAHLRSHQAEHR